MRCLEYSDHHIVNCLIVLRIDESCIAGFIASQRGKSRICPFTGRTKYLNGLPGLQGYAFARCPYHRYTGYARGRG